jgi:hypothetical protein
VKGQASDAWLAKRLAQVETLLDLHSAGMNSRTAVRIQDRISRVRIELERRAANVARVRGNVRLLR